jgi:hypothetical protein
MALRDPATGLSCAETPFYPPKLIKKSDLAVCTSCTLLFSSPSTGPKNYTVRNSFGDGLGIQESALATLTYNGASYALYDTVLWKRGAHRDFGKDVNYDLEMNLYFRSTHDIKNQVAMAIPITIDNSKASPYFTELANQNSGIRTVTLESIVATQQPVLMYKGMDLRLRNASSPVSAAQCSDLRANLTWFIIAPTYISSADAGRIRSVTLPNNVDPPAASTVISLERARMLCMTIPTMSIQSATTTGGGKKKDVYLTRALQCQRIDPNTDVKGDAVYLKDSEKDKTLADELDGIASLDKSLDAVATPGIRPRDMENMLATCIGIAFAIIAFSFIAYYMLGSIYKGYIPTVLRELGTIPDITKAKMKECTSFVQTDAAKEAVEAALSAKLGAKT